MLVKNVVITGDILRVSPTGELSQWLNILRTYCLVADSIAEVIGCTPLVWYGRRTSNDYYSMFNKEPSLIAWTELYYAEPTEQFIAAMGDELQDSLILGFEMPSVMIKAFDANNIPWIDMTVAPLRFLVDLYFSFRFSKHFNVGKLSRFWVTSDEIQQGVNRLREFYGGLRFDWENHILFFPQVRMDKALVIDGGLYSDETAVSEFAKLAVGKSVCIKPHPIDPDNPIVGQFVIQFGAQIIDDNSYAILAKSSGCHFVTISSSIGHEARAFGHDVTFLSPKVTNDNFSSLRCYKDTAFWCDVLSDVMQVRPNKNIAANFLRNQIGYYSMDARIWA